MELYQLSEQREETHSERKGEGGSTYHAGVNKSIFEFGVSGQELLAEEGRILD